MPLAAWRAHLFLLGGAHHSSALCAAGLHRPTCPNAPSHSGGRLLPPSAISGAGLCRHVAGARCHASAAGPVAGPPSGGSAPAAGQRAAMGGAGGDATREGTWAAARSRPHPSRSSWPSPPRNHPSRGRARFRGRPKTSVAQMSPRSPRSRRSHPSCRAAAASRRGTCRPRAAGTSRGS